MGKIRTARGTMIGSPPGHVTLTWPECVPAGTATGWKVNQICLVMPAGISRGKPPFFRATSCRATPIGFSSLVSVHSTWWTVTQSGFTPSGSPSMRSSAVIGFVHGTGEVQDRRAPLTAHHHHGHPVRPVVRRRLGRRDVVQRMRDPGFESGADRLPGAVGPVWQRGGREDH